MLEAAVAVAVLAVVATVAAPALSAWLDSRRLDGAATRVAADIEYVRGAAVARNQPLRLSLRSESDASCWIVHTGTPENCRCGADERPVCGGDAAALRGVALRTAERVAVSANVASILFDPLHGTSTPSGTIRLVDSRGHEIRHVVNVLGRVRSCATANTVSGYRNC